MRQYVGARYVPRFADPIEWDNTRPYEPLTIVTYYGNSYTSKKSVPIGTEITNTEYWVLTGNVNGAISVIEDKIEHIEDEIEEIRQSTPATGGHRRYILMGDSWGTDQTFDGTFVRGWCAITKEALGLSSDDCYIIARSGCGIGKEGNRFDSLLSDNLATIQNKDTITDIVIGSGLNDTPTASYNNIDSGLASLKSIIDTNFPNAKVWLIAVGWTYGAERKKNLERVWNKYNQLAGSMKMSFHSGLHWKYADKSLFVPGNPSHVLDQSSNGYNIANILLGGGVGVAVFDDKPMQLTFADSPNNTLTMGYVSCNSGYKRIYTYRQGMRLTNEISIAGYTKYLLGTVRCDLLDGSYQRRCLISGTIELTTGPASDYVTVTYPCAYVFEEDEDEAGLCKLSVYLQDNSLVDNPITGINYIRVGFMSNLFTMFDV